MNCAHGFCFGRVGRCGRCVVSRHLILEGGSVKGKYDVSFELVCLEQKALYKTLREESIVQTYMWDTCGVDGCPSLHLTSSLEIPNFWHSSIFLSPRSALQSQIEQKFVLIPYQTPPSARTDSLTLPSALQCLPHPSLPNHHSTKPTNNHQTPQAKIPLKPIPHTHYQVRKWRPEN